MAYLVWTTRSDADGGDVRREVDDGAVSDDHLVDAPVEPDLCDVLVLVGALVTAEEEVRRQRELDLLPAECSVRPLRRDSVDLLITYVDIKMSRYNKNKVQQISKVYIKERLYSTKHSSIDSLDFLSVHQLLTYCLL